MLNHKITHNDSFKLFVDIESTLPVELIMIGYEENKPNTVYFYRQYGDRNIQGVGLFQGTHTFEFPFPFPPEKLKIKIFDKETGSTKGLKIKKIKHEKFYPTLTGIFKPHVQEFIDFAYDFALTCATRQYGSHDSKGGLYTIEFEEYVREWENNENPDKIIFTPARIDRISGKIEASKYYFDQLTVVNRFMVLAHEFTHFYFNTTDEIECDIIACNICLLMGFSKTECMYAIARLFDNCGAECEEFIQRKEKVIEFINNWNYDEKLATK